jgi:hypothetical protein
VDERHRSRNSNVEGSAGWNCIVNTYRAISYMMPFGGMKRSGLGRENGMEAIREFLETKSVIISTAQGIPTNVMEKMNERQSLICTKDLRGGLAIPLS